MLERPAEHLGVALQGQYRQPVTNFGLRRKVG